MRHILAPIAAVLMLIGVLQFYTAPQKLRSLISINDMNALPSVNYPSSR